MALTYLLLHYHLLLLKQQAIAWIVTLKHQLSFLVLLFTLLFHQVHVLVEIQLTALELLLSNQLHVEELVH